MTNNTTYYRPIQYLGSKTRVVDTIVSECKKLYIPGEYVVDLFSGSSIVSQSLYKNGMHVIANDVLSFSSDIAACMLNQERVNNSYFLIDHFIQHLGVDHLSQDYTSHFINLIEEEQLLLADMNLAGLRRLYENLSQVGNDNVPNAQVEYIRNHYGISAIGNIPLFANYYAGTYFGIKQSLDIDILRNRIEQEWHTTKDIWEYKVLLTALYNTCSIIVHSAGKHFAQPIAIDENNETKITSVRLFENRAYDVAEVFKCCVANILEATTSNVIGDKSYALNMDICSLDFKDAITDKKVSVIYADPPYTAQQYSRFYHIPEVLHSYIYPQLQIFRGKHTQGVYPDDKYKSPFCSKAKAICAFESIFELASEHQSHLIVSYSESKKVKTGNDRMVTKEDIYRLAEMHLSKYTINQLTFDFDYRQLNNKERIVEDKEDKEILLIFEKQ